MQDPARPRGAALPARPSSAALPARASAARPRAQRPRALPGRGRTWLRRHHAPGKAQSPSSQPGRAPEGKKLKSLARTWAAAPGGWAGGGGGPGGVRCLRRGERGAPEGGRAALAACAQSGHPAPACGVARAAARRRTALLAATAGRAAAVPPGAGRAPRRPPARACGEVAAGGLQPRPRRRAGGSGAALRGPAARSPFSRPQTPFTPLPGALRRSPRGPRPARAPPARTCHQRGQAGR
jgi:hypothetical protein